MYKKWPFLINYIIVSVHEIWEFRVVVKRSITESLRNV